MKRKLAVVVVVILAAGGAQAVELASNYEQLKAIEPFLGSWVYEGPLPFDAPGFAEKRTEVRVVLTNEWALNRNSLVTNWSIQVPAKGSLDGIALIGWDPKTRQIVSRSFDSAGSFWQGVWTVDGKTLTINDQNVGPDGTESSSTTLNRLTERGTMIWQATQQARGGERLPDTPEVEFKPILSATEKGDTNDTFKEFGELLVGRWIGDVTLITDWPGIGKKGEKVVSHMSVRWIADKRGLEDESFGGQGTTKSIYFWDPASKRIRVYSIDSGGTTGDWQIWKEGAKWALQGGGCLADGTEYEGEGEMLFKDGGNTLVYDGAFAVSGTETLDLHDVYRRGQVKRGSRPPCGAATISSLLTRGLPTMRGKYGNLRRAAGPRL